MNNKILTFGSNSRLFNFLKSYLNSSNYHNLSLNKNDGDISDFEKVSDVISAFKPDLVINLSAFNNVDQAEIYSDRALMVNGYSLENLSKICSNKSCCLIHLSTNYIFDGLIGIYDELCSPNPLSVYGKSKLLGENFIKNYLKNFYILRVSNLCSSNCENIFTKSLQNLKKESDIFFVDDAYISLTKYEELAYVINQILLRFNTNEQIDFGTYHFNSFFPLSYYDFAKYIASFFIPEKLNSIKPISFYEYDNLNWSIRPKKAQLDSSKLTSIITNNFLKSRYLKEINYF